MSDPNKSDSTTVVTDTTTPAAVIQGPISASTFDDWLEHFYKECGREITLAYTTLNQMKNWAVLIVAAVVSAIVAMQKSSDPNHSNDFAIFVGTVVAYVFTLRFFVRAILCYNNLVRWNTLQKSIIALKLVHPSPQERTEKENAEQLTTKLLQQIDHLYFKWHAPLTRSTQLLANLKLGFGLLLALPIFGGVIIGLRMMPLSQLAWGILTFAIGYTVVESIDFLSPGFFDTPEGAARRTRYRSGFPTPTTGPRYLILSILNVLLSIVVSFWPEVAVFLREALRCH